MYTRVPDKSSADYSKNLRSPSTKPKPPVRQPNYMEIILRLRRLPDSLTQQDINILRKTIGNQVVIKLLTEIKKIPPQNNQAGKDKEVTPGTQDRQPGSETPQSEKHQSEMKSQDTDVKTLEKAGEQSNSGNPGNTKAASSRSLAQTAKRQAAKEIAADFIKLN